MKSANLVAIVDEPFLGRKMLLDKTNIVNRQTGVPAKP
jgi:hypothetical protein